MKLKRFKEKDNKRIGIIVFTIVCILLVSGVILYRTFAVFEVKTNQNVINGNVQDPGNLYFAFYQQNENTGDYEIQKDMPSKNSGYVLDEEASYCGLNGSKNEDIKVSLNEDWKIIVSGVTTSRTKCNLYFTKGIFLMGHGVPVVTNGNGLYETTHGDEVTSTTNDSDFRNTEYRYAENDPKNYVHFNGELWRIIGLVNVLTSEETVEQRIKVIKNNSIGELSWDLKENLSASNNWTQSTLMELLNGAYYNHTSAIYFNCSEADRDDRCINGANVTLNFENTGIKDSSKHMIEEVTWSLGGLATNPLISDFYNGERGTSVFYDNPAKWKGKIALIYPSDFGYATSGGTEMSRETCLSRELINWSGEYGKNCGANDWLKPLGRLSWTLSSYTVLGNTGFYIGNTGFSKDWFLTSAFEIYPSLYLASNVKIISGTGSSADAFEIAQVLK